jgi:hypothetical protein
MKYNKSVKNFKKAYKMTHLKGSKRKSKTEEDLNNKDEVTKIFIFV